MQATSKFSHSCWVIATVAAAIGACSESKSGPSLASSNFANATTDGQSATGTTDATASQGDGNAAASDGGTVDAAPALPESNKETLKYFEDLLTAVCTKAQACKSVAFHFASIALCKQALAAQFRPEHWALLVGQGKALLSIDNSIQCLKDVAAVCDALHGPPLKACILAVHGTVQKNKPCTAGLCVTTVCQSAGGACGVCVDAISEGNTCGFTWQCNPGQVCAGGLCKTPGTVSALGKCSDTSDCVLSSFCGPGALCAPRLAAGTACTPKQAPCKAGLACRTDAAGNATCGPAGKQGEECYGPKVTKHIASECEAGLVCSGAAAAGKVTGFKGKCLPLRFAGEACESTTQCGPQFAACIAQKCAPWPAAGHLCLHDATLSSAAICAAGHWCNPTTDTCQAGGTSAMACDSFFAQCVAGQFCNNSLACQPVGGIGASCDLATGYGCLPQLMCDDDAKCRTWPQCLP